MVSTTLMSRIPPSSPPVVMNIFLARIRFMAASASTAVKSSLGAGKVRLKVLPKVVAKVKRRIFFCVLSAIFRPSLKQNSS
ncbi:hypothetical protein DSY2142 [Desulfitobacterium hafniense Y51]|uniref:Uncharacterized protein n=1 Tax=Desulfitobacterium hafniense (strain Y51) TaxID=138119 RepID=Q24VL1_DESHY|nr:hypothetical protein DSY2142 [Desulfitobacterium hafniense Y51]